MLLEAFSWLGFLVVALFATLCLAAGLFYLAELVEEFTGPTKRALRIALLVIVGIQIVLGVFTTIPLLWVTVIGVAAHAFYYRVVATFPYLYLTSPSFIGSAVFLCLHHYVVFEHFAVTWYPFDQVTSYFVICVWLVPFTLFISLSANEHTLPSLQTASSSQMPVDVGAGSGRKRHSILHDALNFLRRSSDRNKTF